MKIQSIPLDCISLYSLVKNMPRWADDSEDMRALADDIATRGIEQPLFITGQDHGHSKKNHFYLIDGRHRFFAAKKAGLLEVPCVARAETDAGDIILHSLAQRRHLTKGQQAYICYPVIADGLHNGSGKPAKNNGSKSFDAVAEALGFSRAILFQAKRVHEIFDESPEYRATAEPRLLAAEDPSGLGGVIAGYAGMISTSGKRRRCANYLSLRSDGTLYGVMPNALASLENGFKNWSKLDLTARGELRKTWFNFLKKLPEDLR